MDPLLYFVIAIFWAIASWLQRRNEAKAEAEQENQAERQPSGPIQSKPAGGGGGWEEELRMLLEGKVPSPDPKPVPKPAAPAPRAVPPPPSVPSPPSAPRVSAPPPLPSSSQPAPVSETRSLASVSAAPKLVSDIDGDYFHKGLCIHCGGRLLFPDGAIGHTLNCPHCNTDTPLRPSEALAAQNVAAQAYARKRAPRETMAAEVADMFADKESARQAVVASIVFGPPKALQPDNGGSLF